MTALAPCGGPIADIRAALDDGCRLPLTLGDWAYRNGILAYSFEDEYGDGYCGYFCGNCAENRIQNHDPRFPLAGRYVTLTSLRTSEPDLYCDDCGEELSN